IEKTIVRDVHAARDLALEVKKINKLKKRSRILKILDRLQEHGGPCSPSNIDSLLPGLISNQLIHEITYLRATVNPDIRQKQRVKQADGSFKMVQFSDEILRTAIRNTVKPE
ncbi:unnamed protein product, partial [Meganyctiphanes norvegica]